MEKENLKSDIFKRFNKILNTDDKKLNMLLTYIGMAAAMTDYLSKTRKIETLPPIIQYAMVIVAGNAYTFFTSNEEVEVQDIEEMGIGADPDNYNEQTEEAVLRKMKRVIKEFNDMIEREEKV